MPKLSDIKPGDTLPERAYLATNVSLFLYNAAVWNPHRIHYDERYTREEEHHPGIIIDGPLQGDWMSQTVLDWLGADGELLEFEYSNRRASILGETLRAGGLVATIDGDEVTLDLYIKNESDEVTTPGHARVRLIEHN